MSMAHTRCRSHRQTAADVQARSLIPTAPFCRMLGSQLPIKLGVLSCLLSAPADTKGGATTAGRQGIQLGQRGRGPTNNASSIIFCAFMSAASWWCQSLSRVGHHCHATWEVCYVQLSMCMRNKKRIQTPANQKQLQGIDTSMAYLGFWCKFTV